MTKKDRKLVTEHAAQLVEQGTDIQSLCSWADDNIDWDEVWVAADYAESSASRIKVLVEDYHRAVEKAARKPTRKSKAKTRRRS